MKLKMAFKALVIGSSRVRVFMHQLVMTTCCWFSDSQTPRLVFNGNRVLVRGFLDHDDNQVQIGDLIDELLWRLTNSKSSIWSNGAATYCSQRLPPRNEEVIQLGHRLASARNIITSIYVRKVLFTACTSALQTTSWCRSGPLTKGSSLFANGWSTT